MDVKNGPGVPQETLDAEVESFFESAPPLKNRDDISEKLEEFVERNSALSGNGRARRVVCVTSGGTTVPLEQRCVRYIDNFSSGHRGAASTEYVTFHHTEQEVCSLQTLMLCYQCRRVDYLAGILLRPDMQLSFYIAGELFSYHDIPFPLTKRSLHGWKRIIFKSAHDMVDLVCILSRGTYLPYCRSLPEDPLVECFEITDESNIRVHPSHSEAVKKAITEHHAAVAEGHLLKLPFTTIFEYLQMLQMIAVSTSRLGANAMFYLAAAVSDFYVPWKSMAEHKIQSASGPLDMRLVQVPKMLSVLRKDWAPMAFCISFKLETDAKILLEKADMALKKNKMHMVVANELSNRKEEVVVVTANEKISVRRDKTQVGDDVENHLIGLLVERHSTYLENPDL